MPGKARRVQITERQQKVLLEFSRSRSEAKSHVQRAQIILAAFDGRLNEDIASEVGLNRKHVGRWRRRGQDGWDEVIKRGLVENISGCQISRYLRDAHLQPHRRKMWINTKRGRPRGISAEGGRGLPDVPAGVGTFRTRTVCCDETTGSSCPFLGSILPNFTVQDEFDRKAAKGTAKRQLNY
jgi:hypothetical protein